MSPEEEKDWEAILPGLLETRDDPRGGCWSLVWVMILTALFWASVVVWAVVVR